MITTHICPLNFPKSKCNFKNDRVHQPSVKLDVHQFLEFKWRQNGNHHLPASMETTASNAGSIANRQWSTGDTTGLIDKEYRCRFWQHDDNRRSHKRMHLISICNKSKIQQHDWCLAFPEDTTPPQSQNNCTGYLSNNVLHSFKLCLFV